MLVKGSSAIDVALDNFFCSRECLICIRRTVDIESEQTRIGTSTKEGAICEPLATNTTDDTESVALDYGMQLLTPREVLRSFGGKQELV